MAQPTLLEDPLSGRWLEGARFELGPSPVRSYRTQEAIAPEQRTLAAMLAANLDHAPRFSACLSRAAQAYAAFHPYQADPQPPREFLEFTLHWAGCPDSSAAVRLYHTTDDGREGLEGYLRELGALEQATHVGIGRAPGKGNPYRWTWAILSTERQFELEPLAQHLPGPQSEPLELRFSLDPGLDEPVLWLLAPDGQMLRYDPSPAPTPGAAGFHVSLSFDKRPGPWWVELLANGALGPQVIALFPVYVGAPFPESWSGVSSRDESFVSTEGDAEALVFELVNRERLALGLEALQWDEALAQVARGHAQEMRDRNFFAHTSPFSGGLSQRLASAGYAARYSAENLARNGSIYDAHDSLMRSVGHRANILSAMPSHLGVGVVRGEAENGEQSYYITQNFSRPIGLTSASELASQVRRSCLEHAASPPQLSTRWDRELEQLYQRYDNDDDASNALAAALQKEGVRYRQFGIQRQNILEASDFRVPEEGLGENTLLLTAVLPSNGPTARDGSSDSNLTQQAKRPIDKNPAWSWYTVVVVMVELAQ
ncbi:MAG: CAP domain-containing protein [Myxococcota bacterium]|nr:CAP domain-containing protein [Myxococcota bacterium]